MRANNISTEWYFRCGNDAERANRKGLVDSSTPVLALLKDMASKRKEDLQNVRESDYDTGEWAYLQAHRNGRIEELDRLIKLIGSATDHE